MDGIWLCSINSDNWLEQGNICAIPSTDTTIVLFKEFKDASYHIIAGAIDRISSNRGEGVSIGTRYTDRFIAHGYHATAMVDLPAASWMAFGYC